MSERNEANLEYRAEFDFTQARAQIQSIQESLRAMEQIGLAAFISIEDRASQSASAIVAKFSQAAKESGVSAVTQEVNDALDAVNRLKEASAEVKSTPVTTSADSPSSPSGGVFPDVEDRVGDIGTAAVAASTGFEKLSTILGLSGTEAAKVDAIYARLLTQEIRLVASGDDLTRSLAARIGARQPDAELINNAIRLTERLTEAEIADADERARLNAIIEYSAGVKSKDADVQQSAIDAIGRSISALEAEADARKRVAAEAQSASVAQVAASKEAGQAVRESLGQRIDDQIAAAQRATEAEVAAAQRQVAAVRERVAAERDAAIALLQGKDDEARAYEDAARVASDAERQAAEEIRSAIQSRNEAYDNAAQIAKDSESQAAEAVKSASEERIAAEQAAIKDAAQGRREAAAVQKATAQEAAAVERQASATQVAAIRARESVQRQAAQTASASAKLEASVSKESAKAREQAERQVQAAARETARVRDQAARLFENTIKRTFPQEAQQLNQLVEKYGSFTATIRANGQAMNDLEKEIQDIIQANPQLAREVDILTKKVGEFNTNANRTTFRGGEGGNLIVSADDIRKTGFALERFGVTGVAAFGEIFAAIGPVGIAIGALILTIGGLVKIFKEVASAGIRAFQELITKSIQAGRQTEITKAQFEAFFKGLDVPDPFAASEATLNRLQQLSRTYGQDFTQLGRSLLPNVSGLDQLEEAVKLAASLASIDPTAGIAGAQQSLRAALGGDLTSLYKQFEIPKATIERIRELQEELGATEGLIVGLGEYFRSTGQDIDSLSGTANVAIGKIGVLRTQFERTTGAPIIEQIKESLNDIFDIIDSHQDDIFSIANAIGVSVASVLDLLSGFATDFLEDIDPGKIRDVAFEIRDAVDAIATIFAAATGGGADAADILEFILEKITFVVEVTKAWALGTASIIAFLKSAYEIFVLLTAQAALFTLGVNGNVVALQRALEINPKDEISGILERNFEAINTFVDRSEQARAANDAFNESLGADQSNAEAAADAALQLADARRQLAQVTEELAEAQATVAEKRAEFELEYNRAQIELAVEQTRRVTDSIIDAARKRVDAALENARKLSDIVRDYNQKVEDAARNLDRKQQDIARDEADRLGKIARDSADKRLKIEEDYLRKVEDLRRKFAFDSQEAIRANDAIAYLRLQRKLQFDLEQAAIDRDRKLADVDDDDQKARDDEARRRDQARRDAQIDYERKLEDLRIAVEREIQERATAYQRELVDLQTAEARKREDLERSFQQQKEDFERNWSEKLTDLERNLRDEFELIAANERKKIELQQQAWQAEKKLLQEQARERAALIQQQGGTINPRYGGGGFVPDYGQGDGGEGAGGTLQPLKPRGPKQPADYTAEEVEQLRQQARDLARRMNNDELLRLIATMTVQQLVTLLRSAGVLRDSGGHVRAGDPAKIGKPELLIPGSSGFIYPLDVLRPMLKQPPANVVTDNSKRADVNLSLLDPSMVDLQRKSIIKEMIREVLEDVL